MTLTALILQQIHTRHGDSAYEIAKNLDMLPRLASVSSILSKLAKAGWVERDFDHVWYIYYPPSRPCDWVSATGYKCAGTISGIDGHCSAWPCPNS